LLGVFVTSFYSFRLLYLTFHGEERFRDAHAHDDHAHGAHDADAHDAHHDDHGHGHGAHEPHESPWVVTLPLILLAIPSIAIGFLTVGPMLFGTDMMGHEKQLPFFLGAIDVLQERTSWPRGRGVPRPGGVRAARLQGAGVLAGTAGLPAGHPAVPGHAGMAPGIRARWRGRSRCSSTSTSWTTCGSAVSPVAA
jgi:hypothetical protein